MRLRISRRALKRAGASEPVARMRALLAKPEPFNESLVLVRVRALEVIEKLATPADHAKQATARVVVLHVRFEVLGEVRDTRSQKRNLDFRRSSVALRPLVILDQLL